MNSSTSPCSGRSTTPDMWEGVIEYVENARTIAISGHTNPDGDALGSEDTDSDEEDVDEQ